MKVAVINQKGEKITDMAMPKIFDIKIDDSAFAQYLLYLRSALRNSVANTKDRSEVSGGGCKPWRQKGTGRARAGSSRSPLWVGGGVTFGPSSERNFKQRINKKEKRAAILGVIADFSKNKKLTVVDGIKFDKPSTKEATNILNKINVEGKISVFVDTAEKNILLSLRNINGVHVMTPQKMDFLNLVSSNWLVITSQALKKIEEIYTSKKDESKKTSVNDGGKTE